MKNYSIMLWEKGLEPRVKIINQLFVSNRTKNKQKIMEEDYSSELKADDQTFDD